MLSTKIETPGFQAATGSKKGARQFSKAKPITEKVANGDDFLQRHENLFPV
jgi:hypothetical protein